MKKLNLEMLKVQSFVTKEVEKITGGDSFPACSNGQVTCALNCSDTDGRRACKDPANYTAYFC